MAASRTVAGGPRPPAPDVSVSAATVEFTAWQDRINDEDVKAVRDAVPIDAVVSEYLQLRNAGGGNLKGLCPFHDEKSPSFQVSPSKGLFHCFGCQEGGDTIDFVMKVDHLSFSEAVERLAAQAGITLRYEEGGYNPGQPAGRAHPPGRGAQGRRRSSTPSSWTRPRGRDRPQVPRRARLRPGRRRALRRRLQPGRAGTTSPASCAARASPTRS